MITFSCDLCGRKIISHSSTKRHNVEYLLIMDDQRDVYEYSLKNPTENMTISGHLCKECFEKAVDFFGIDYFKEDTDNDDSED